MGDFCATKRLKRGNVICGWVRAGANRRKALGNDVCKACLSRRIVLGAVLALAAGRVGAAVVPRLAISGLMSPHMRLAGGVALTLDCCDGGVDHRILDMLVSEGIPATLFVSGKWVIHNPDAVAMAISMPELFEIGNHGARHLMCVDTPGQDWGVRSAGSAQGVADEVTGGAKLLQAAGSAWPKWYRGAAALYTEGGLEVARSLGYRIAGFSLNGDDGATLGAEAAAARIGRAVAGDVIIAHLNQPHRTAGEGVAKGILALRDRGMQFVKLSDPENVITAI